MLFATTVSQIRVMTFATRKFLYATLCLRPRAAFVSNTSDWFHTARNMLVRCKAIIQANAHGRNGPGLEDISGILVNSQNVQIDVVNKPYLFATRTSQIRYLRYRAVVAAHAPDRRRNTSSVLT